MVITGMILAAFLILVGLAASWADRAHRTTMIIQARDRRAAWERARW